MDSVQARGQFFEELFPAGIVGNFAEDGQLCLYSS